MEVDKGQDDNGQGQGDDFVSNLQAYKLLSIRDYFNS